MSGVLFLFYFKHDDTCPICLHRHLYKECPVEEKVFQGTKCFPRSLSFFKKLFFVVLFSITRCAPYTLFDPSPPLGVSLNHLLCKVFLQKRLSCHRARQFSSPLLLTGLAARSSLVAVLECDRSSSPRQRDSINPSSSARLAVSLCRQFM